MSRITDEYEAAADQYRTARGEDERVAAKARWDAAKKAMDESIAERERAADLAEQIAVLYGWCPAHEGTDREKALSQLWREWTDIKGYLRDHPALTDERISELAAQREATRADTIRRRDALLAPSR